MQLFECMRTFTKKSMRTAELKLKIFRQIDQLNPNQLKKVYILLNDTLNRSIDISGWEELSEEQKNGLLDAIKQMDDGLGIASENVSLPNKIYYSTGLTTKE